MSTGLCRYHKTRLSSSRFCQRRRAWLIEECYTWRRTQSFRWLLICFGRGGCARRRIQIWSDIEKRRFLWWRCGGIVGVILCGREFGENRRRLFSIGIERGLTGWKRICDRDKRWARRECIFVNRLTWFSTVRNRGSDGLCTRWYHRLRLRWLAGLRSNWTGCYFCGGRGCRCLGRMTTWNIPSFLFQRWKRWRSCRRNLRWAWGVFDGWLWRRMMRFRSRWCMRFWRLICFARFTNICCVCWRVLCTRIILCRLMTCHNVRGCHRRNFGWSKKQIVRSSQVCFHSLLFNSSRAGQIGWYHREHVSDETRLVRHNDKSQKNGQNCSHDCCCGGCHTRICLCHCLDRLSFYHFDSSVSCTCLALGHLATKAHLFRACCNRGRRILCSSALEHSQCMLVTIRKHWSSIAHVCVFGVTAIETSMSVFAKNIGISHL